MDIQITPMPSEGVQRHLQISVPVETVREAENKAALKYASQVRLPGFRPGKAPAAMVRKRFGDAIRQAALESLVQDAYTAAVEQEKLDLAGQPHIHDLNFKDGEPLTFTLHAEVRPRLELENLSGFQVTRPSTEVTDEMVVDQLDEMRDQQATWSPTEDRPMSGDMVTVLLATADDEGELPEGKEYRLVLGTGQAIEPVEEVIMGATAGEVVERQVKWPDDFPDETQRGTSKLVRVDLREVKRKELPALDDAFARGVGDFESLDALRAAVRSDMEANAGREADAQVRQQIIEQVIAANAFDVPVSWVDRLTAAYADAYQVPEAERERFAQEFRPMAETQVRRDLIVEAIADREKLTASESDIDDRVAEMATARKMEPGQLYASLQKAGRLAELERAITEERVFDYLLEQNPVS